MLKEHFNITFVDSKKMDSSKNQPMENLLGTTLLNRSQRPIKL